MRFDNFLEKREQTFSSEFSPGRFVPRASLYPRQQPPTAKQPVAMKKVTVTVATYVRERKYRSGIFANFFVISRRAAIPFVISPTGSPNRRRPRARTTLD